MRLVIDCFKLIKGTGKSIGIYNVALGIVRHLGERANEQHSDDLKIIVLGNNLNKEDFDVPGVEFIEVTKYDPTNKIHFVMWELFYVSSYCKRLKADRVFFPRGYTAMTHPVDDIVLIHDLIPFYYNENFPDVFNKVENAYIMARLKQSARSAKKVVTISQASKKDIISYCGVKESKIVVINNSCEAIEAKTEKPDKPYICAMTSTLPHKNAKGVVEAYKGYAESTDNPLDLVIIGLKDVDDYEMSDETRRRITCHKFIKNNDEMYRIIGGSEMFLFLSLIEGFGLPPVEAMQLGVPVICSNTSSLPEVVDDAGILVDPRDYDGIAQTIKTLSEDKGRRNELVDKGFINIRRFSSEKMANAYWNVLVGDKWSSGI